MDETGKNLPPSTARLAAAARSGLFPRSPLLITGIALLCGAFALHICGGYLYTGILQLVKFGMENATKANMHLIPQYLALAKEIGMWTLVLLIIIGGSTAGVSLVLALAARRKKGVTSTPLPSKISPGFFHSAITVVSFLCAILASLLVFTDANIKWLQISPSGALFINAMGPLVVHILATFGTIFVLGGLTQLSIYKTVLLKQLSLSTMDMRREQRIHGQDKLTRLNLQSFRQVDPQ